MQNKKRNFPILVLGMVSTFALSVAFLPNANAGPPASAKVDLTVTLNEMGVDLTLTTSAEPDTTALLIIREEKRGNGAAEITVVCGFLFPSGGFSYTCTDNVVGDHYRAAEIEGSLILQNQAVKPILATNNVDLTATLNGTSKRSMGKM